MIKGVSLRQLSVGQKGRIVSIAAPGELGRRIRDMGLVPGAEVKVLGRAPLRGPVALRVNDCTLTLGAPEAEHIVVSTQE